jgi:hypothetical protein
VSLASFTYSSIHLCISNWGARLHVISQIVCSVYTHTPFNSVDPSIFPLETHSKRNPCHCNCTGKPGPPLTYTGPIIASFALEGVAVRSSRHQSPTYRVDESLTPCAPVLWPILLHSGLRCPCFDHTMLVVHFPAPTIPLPSRVSSGRAGAAEHYKRIVVEGRSGMG